MFLYDWSLSLSCSWSQSNIDKWVINLAHFLFRFRHEDYTMQIGNENPLFHWIILKFQLLASSLRICQSASSYLIIFLLVINYILFRWLSIDWITRRPINLDTGSYLYQLRVYISSTYWRVAIDDDGWTSSVDNGRNIPLRILLSIYPLLSFYTFYRRPVD